MPRTAPDARFTLLDRQTGEPNHRGDPMPDPEPIQVPPSVDDELVVTVRLRLAGRDVLEVVEGPALTSLPGQLHAAVKGLLSPGNVDLAGIEIALPDFRPYGAPGKVTHEFTGPEPATAAQADG